MSLFTLPGGASESVFSGADVCFEAGLGLPDEARRPMFDDDLWDFTHVVGLPNQMSKVSRRFDFAAIINPRWRLVAKEQVMAMIATAHPQVAQLPRAYRTPLHLVTAFGRLAELTRFLNWLTSQGISGLDELDEHRCDGYLAHRRYLLDEDGGRVGESSPATRRAAAQTVVDLINHCSLFTSDAPPTGLRPWGGAAPSAIAEMPAGTGINKTPPVGDHVLQPLLAAALFLTERIGPHAIDLHAQVKDADRRWSLKSGDHKATTRLPREEILHVLADYEERDEPLPLLADHDTRRRIDQGWLPHDPLTPIAFGLLTRQAGVTQFYSRWLPALREAVESTLNRVGAAKQFARNAAPITLSDGSGQLPWTFPLDRLQATALIGIVRTAAITTLAAVSGMRSSELMELQVGCRRPPETHGPGLVRYRIASKVIKGQVLGGVDDEWVVIQPAYTAAGLLEQLHDNPVDGTALLGRFAFDVRYTWLRNWVNGPAGQRLGLAPIPDDSVNLRALRRTLALELAYRPGGVLATKIHLKHVAVATTEGYASRPGGAQAELLAEVNKHESEHNLDLVWEEFRNYQQGIMPAGPGARDLIAFFAHIDAKLDPADAPAAKVQRNDREILSLLTKRAKVLHLGPANYCWFTDPSRALCLRLAGTPTADRPLIGMCDSARCPQATHHPCHRPVWTDHADKTKAFLAELGPTRRTERTRLQADYDRAARVVTAIDTASGSHP
ncbi:hypothetical protein ACFV1N_48410 [Streptosporangium canum]|uniref:hypothetical protein n=1 Tax=Streptosporangium canum TaxID=324952 RepID=UPI0036C95E84